MAIKICSLLVLCRSVLINSAATSCGLFKGQFDVRPGGPQPPECVPNAYVDGDAFFKLTQSWQPLHATCRSLGDASACAGNSECEWAAAGPCMDICESQWMGGGPSSCSSIHASCILKEEDKSFCEAWDSDVDCSVFRNESDCRAGCQWTSVSAVFCVAGHPPGEECHAKVDATTCNANPLCSWPSMCMPLGLADASSCMGKSKAACTAEVVPDPLSKITTTSITGKKEDSSSDSAVARGSALVFVALLNMIALWS